MPTAKCSNPTCNSTGFELETKGISEAKKKQCLVKCSKCGAVVGVLPGKDVGLLHIDVMKELKEIKEMIERLEK